MAIQTRFHILFLIRNKQKKITEVNLPKDKYTDNISSGRWKEEDWGAIT